MEYRNLILEYMKRVEKEMVAIKEETEKQLEIIQQEKVLVIKEGDAKLNAARHSIDILNAILSEMEKQQSTQGVRGHIPKANYADMNNMTHGECIEHIKKHEFGQ